VAEVQQDTEIVQSDLLMASRVRAAFGKMILLRGSRGLYSITKLISG
jgi:hypothetical protein